MRLVSFDPGGTTGYAIFTREGEGQWRILATGEFPADALGLEVIDSIIKPGDQVIYEQIYVFHRTIKTVGLEVIGAIRHCCAQRGIEPEARTPGYLQGIRRWPMTIEPPIVGKHARDAVHHGIVFLGAYNIGGVTFAD